MAKLDPAPTETSIRDSKSGRLVTVRGLGALKGQLEIGPDIDLTKPIAAQVLEQRQGSKRGRVDAKP